MLERRDDKSFKRDIIVLIGLSILFVLTSFLAHIGKEMSFPGFHSILSAIPSSNLMAAIHMFLCKLK